MKRKIKGIKHWQLVRLYLFLYDIIAINLSYFFALWLRFDLSYLSIPGRYFNNFIYFVPIYSLISVFIFYLNHLYSSIWRFASFTELNRIVFSSILTSLLHVIGINLLFGSMPISYYIIGFLSQTVLLIGVRFSYRYITLIRAVNNKKNKAIYNAMVIGAGDAGQLIIRDLKKSNKTLSKPVCIIDDNPNKWGRTIEGIPVVGGRDDILSNVKKYNVDKIMFAIPTASNEEKKEILNICNDTDCELAVLPELYKLKGEPTINQLKPVQVEDLLGRKTIKINNEEVYKNLKNKTILVTGGGGSIGSELCRQIAKHDPKRLIIFDIYENNAYDIEQELRRHLPNLKLDVLIGSVRDRKRLDYVFNKYKPDLVYHAAAHKHVPLMENSPCESIKNNVIGTYNTAFLALKYNVKTFVLVSTDKAVNPTNIMGASKRLCEMIIQSMNKISIDKDVNLINKINEQLNLISTKKELNEIINSKKTTKFVAVRFGNVLGSNGSVIPLFKKQIEEGGPITVTHPDIIRYFMTIPEAVSLILQAGTYAKGGEIFVLDMGEPVKIDTLAKNLIKLSGLTLGKDIDIAYTGLRPGEKLYEEKLMDEEGMEKTDNKLIHIGKPIPFKVDKFINDLVKLEKVSYDNDENIVMLVSKVVKTFNPVGKNPTGKELNRKTD